MNPKLGFIPFYRMGQLATTLWPWPYCHALLEALGLLVAVLVPYDPMVAFSFGNLATVMALCRLASSCIVNCYIIICSIVVVVMAMNCGLIHIMFECGL